MNLTTYIGDIRAHDGLKERTICLDFDGTLAHGSHGLIGPMKKNSIALIQTLQKLGYRVVILTANHNPDVVAQHLVKHGVSTCIVTSKKPEAYAYVDTDSVQWSGDQPIGPAVKRIQELVNEKSQ